MCTANEIKEETKSFSGVVHRGIAPRTRQLGWRYEWPQRLHFRAARKQLLSGLWFEDLVQADLCAALFEPDIIHEGLHQMDASAAFTADVLDRRRVGDLCRVEPTSLVLDHDGQDSRGVNGTGNVHFLSGVLPIPMNHRVGQGLTKRDLNVVFDSGLTTKYADQAHEPVHKRGNRLDFASHLQIRLNGWTDGLGHGESRFEAASAIHCCRTSPIHPHCHPVDHLVAPLLPYSAPHLHAWK